MTRNVKKLLLSIVMLLLVVFLVSCGGGTETTSTGGDGILNDGTTVGATTTTAPETEADTVNTEEITPVLPSVPLVENGEALISIVYPAEYMADEVIVAGKLAEFIQEVSGVYPELYPDSVPVPNGKIQILIGDTSRTPRLYKRTSLNKGEYIISFGGDKIIINAAFGDTLYYVLERIEKEIIKHESYQTGGVQLPFSVEGKHYAEPIREEYFKLGSLTMSDMYECGDGCYMLLFDHAALDTFYDYLAVLAQNGLSEREAPRHILQSEDASPQNYYAMYADDSSMATVLYTEYNNQMRVFLERTSSSGYSHYVNDNTASNVCDPLLLQMGISKDITNGMCYIFRFSNGEFFIFDGGFNDGKYEDELNCHRIVSLLKEYAPDPENIHIAGWLVTHPHTDHIGALEYFCNNYLDDETITLENLLLNNPSSAVADEDTSSTNLSLKVNDYRTSIEKAAALGVRIHKLHPGQRFRFGSNAELEILYTNEMRLHEPLGASNNLSVVSRFTVEGQTYLFAGDTHKDSNLIFNKMYGNSYRSDFYQAAHHGYGPNTVEFVKNSDPKWVLWPCGTSRITETAKREYNLYLFSEQSRVEDIFYAENKTFVFELPFNGKNYTVSGNKALSYFLPETDKDGYVLIYDFEDLLNIKANLHGKYRLANDIDVVGSYLLSNYESALYGAICPFYGVIDGNGHTIDFSRADITFAAGGTLFFQTLSGVIQNLTISGLDITSNATDSCIQSVLGVWSENAILTNVHIDFKYTHTTDKTPVFGALVGKVIKSTKIRISNCSVTCNAKSNKGQFGGFIGAVAAEGCMVNVFDSVSYGTLELVSGSAAGFFGNVAEGTVSLTGCTNVMDITALNAGGIVSYASGASTVQITSCKNEGVIKTSASKSSIAGGMMATCKAASTVNIRGCVNNGTVAYGVKPANDSVHLGEMFGYAADSVGAKITVTNCTNNGKVE